MKKLFFAIAAAAMVLGAASCQKSNFGAVENKGKTLDRITVNIAADTRLDINEANGKLMFDQGDVIFSWDEYDVYEYECVSVDESGNATFEATTASVLSAEPGNKVFMVYAPEYDTDDVDDYNRLKIDISEFEASEFSDLPIVMTAKGVVNDQGGCALTFKNAVAPIKVENAALAASTSFTKISAIGLYAKMTYSVDEEGNFIESPDYMATTVANTAAVATDGSGKATFWLASFVTPEGNTANTVEFTAFSESDQYFCETSKPQTVNSGEFVKFSDKTFTKAAGIIKVGETVYSDMASAVAAINSASSPVTATFLEHIALQDSIVITNMAAEITIDLNGKTILAPDAKVCGFKVKGATSVVNIIDSKGCGKIDHTYDGSMATVVVDGGTLNLLSGSLCNTTGGGYGRVAVSVLAQTAKATFNVKGGAVIGSRAILVGSGISSNLAVLNVSGGLVKGTSTSSGSYPAIGNSDYKSYASINITGGSIVTTGMKINSAIHIKSDTGVDVTIGSEEGSTPYFYVTKPAGYLFSGSTNDCEATFNIFKCYGNKNEPEEDSIVFDDCDVNPLDPPVKDEYGFVYGYQVVAK